MACPPPFTCSTSQPILPNTKGEDLLEAFGWIALVFIVIGLMCYLEEKKESKKNTRKKWMEKHKSNKNFGKRKVRGGSSLPEVYDENMTGFPFKGAGF